MIIKAQNGSIFNSDRFAIIYRHNFDVMILETLTEQSSECLYRGDTVEGAEEIMSDLNKAFATCKDYFDVMRYKRERDNGIQTH